MVHMTAMGGDPTAGAGCPPGPEGWRKGMADIQENVACQNDHREPTKGDQIAY